MSLEIFNDIIAFYGTASEPNFGKVNEVYENQPYKYLIDLISKECDEIIEETDLNTEVSFLFCVKKSDVYYSLYLSMVGNYFFFVKKVSDDFQKPILNMDEIENVFEQHILIILEQHNIKSIDLKSLKKTINFNLFDDNNPTIYRLLFSDDNFLDFVR